MQAIKSQQTIRDQIHSIISCLYPLTEEGSFCRPLQRLQNLVMSRLDTLIDLLMDLHGILFVSHLQQVPAQPHIQAVITRFSKTQ